MSEDKGLVSNIIDLIKSSKIIQVGILFILLSLSIAVINSDKISIWGLEVDVQEEVIEEDNYNKNNSVDQKLIHPDILFKKEK